MLCRQLGGVRTILSKVMSSMRVLQYRHRMLCVLFSLTVQSIVCAQLQPSPPPVQAPAARLTNEPTSIYVEHPVLPSHSRPDILGKTPSIVLPALDVSRLRRERDQREEQLRLNLRDSLSGKRPARPQRHEIGVTRPVEISEPDGKWFVIGDKRVWTLNVNSSLAVKISLHFVHFALPAAMTLYVSGSHDDQPPIVFRGTGPFPSGDFWSPPFDGENIHIEVLDDLPRNHAPAPIQISEVGHAYDSPLDGGFGTLAACELDASCFSSYAGVGDAVAAITFTEQGSLFTCSAVLLNNLSGDFSPLLLTANHCINSDAVAQTISATWFYHSTACNSGQIGLTHYSQYGTLLATSPTDTGSDASLIQLLGILPDNVQWAAWSTQDPAFEEDVTGVHHPHDSYRRIAFGKRTADSRPDYFTVGWSQGTVEPGSSGSPLLNAQQQVIGQLYGGTASCSSGASSYYGRLSSSYGQLVSATGLKYLEQGLPDDSYAPNHTRDTAATLAAAVSLKNLVVKKTRDDWYKITVAPNVRVDVTTSSSYTGYGVVELELVSDTAVITGKKTYDDVRILSYFSPNQQTDLYLHVFLSAGVRQTYSLDVTLNSVPPSTVAGDYNQFFATKILLSAQVNTGGWPTTGYFEWGTDPTLADHSTTDTVSVNPSLPGAPFGVYQNTITGLAPGTNYYFRSLVSSPTGTGSSSIFKTFTYALPAPFLYLPPNGASGVPLSGTTLQSSASNEVTSTDLYFGTAPDPPFVGNFAGSSGTVSFDTSTLLPNTRYYWRAVSRYLTFTNSSAVNTFSTANLLAASPDAVSFPPQPIFTRQERYLQIYAGSNPFGAFNVGSVSVVGNFQIRNSCAGAVVSPTQSCTMFVIFAPTAIGPQSGQVVVTGDAMNSPLEIPITATAVDLQLSLVRPARPVRPTAVSAGQSVSIQLSVGSLDRNPKNISLSCEVIPSKARCTLSANAIHAGRKQKVTVLFVARAPNGEADASDRDNGPYPATPPGDYTVRVVEDEAGIKTHLDIPVRVR
jgi:V8-like Glu-specific endopeptidase